MWNLSRSGIEPMSPELAGGFSTTEQPGKPFATLLQLNIKFFLFDILCDEIFQEYCHHYWGTIALPFLAE